MTLEEAICTAVALKKGDKSFILSNEGYPNQWYAGIGNPVTCVNLGESSPEVSSETFDTPLEAVVDLISKLRKEK